MRNAIRIIVSLVVILALSTGIAFADEITFRKVPWFSDYDTTMAALSDMDVSWKKPEKKLGILIADEVITSLDKAEMDYPCICYVGCNKRNTSVKVAGYDVEEVSLYFAYTPDKNGSIEYDTDNTSFYMACYKISTDESGYAASIRDLKKKLSDLYGTPKEVDMSSDCNSTTKDYYQWKGENNTFAYINGEPNDVWDYYYIRIWYGTASGDSLVKKAEKIQEDGNSKKLQEGGSDGL